jgi:uncharacterized protein (TIGR02147 family)
MKKYCSKDVHELSWEINIKYLSIMDIFEFFDYRRYLDAYYDYKKGQSRSFSYRAFAQRAGYTSSGLYIDLVKGNKNLTPSLVEKFSKALGLSEKEQKYFHLMVDFSHASDYQLKQDVFDEMMLLMPNKSRKLNKNQKDYYNHWYYVAVREALSVWDVSENYEDLALKMLPVLTPGIIRKAIQVLKDLGLIERNELGFWKSVDRTIQAGELDKMLIRSFQKEMISLALDALDEFDPDDRNISCVTFSVSEEGMKRLREKVDTFRSEVMKIIRSDVGENRICQFNVQLFPLSNKK